MAATTSYRYLYRIEELTPTLKGWCDMFYINIGVSFTIVRTGSQQLVNKLIECLVEHGTIEVTTSDLTFH